MEKITGPFYKFAAQFVKAASLLLVAILFLSGFFFTCYTEDMNTQVVLKKADNILISLLGLAIATVVFVAAAYWVCKKPLRRKPFLLCLIIGWYLLAGLILVLFGKSVPSADSMSIYSIAEALAKGDISVIHPTDSYISYYPQQIGLVAFYELLIRLWRLLPVDLAAYHFIKCINVLFACMLVFFQYKTVHLLFKSDKADCIYLLLAGTNLPLLFYTSFVYGEVPSFSLFSLGLWALLKLLKEEEAAPSRPKPPYPMAVICLLALTGSVMLRKNSLILIIAVLLVLFFQWLKTGGYRLLLFAALCAFCMFSVLPLTQFGYELRTGNTISSGVPSASYFAMGMQESSRANGWYNGFNFNTYQDSGMDTAAANVISRQAISERLDYFGKHPVYALTFYWNKFLSQWADGTYACRQASIATFGGRHDFFSQVYDGAYSIWLIRFCNLYQNMLYLGTLLFCLLFTKKKLPFSKCSIDDSTASPQTGHVFTGLPLYIGLIGVIGGFLFHMLWEANARYILPYGLLLLPYCAYGLSRVIPDSCVTAVSSFIKQHRPSAH